MGIDTEKAIDATEAARILEVTRQAIYNFIADGDLEAWRVGMRQWLISRSSVMDLKKRRNHKNRS